MFDDALHPIANSHTELYYCRKSELKDVKWRGIFFFCYERVSLDKFLRGGGWGVETGNISLCGQTKSIKTKNP